MKLLTHLKILILISVLALVTTNVFAQSVGPPPPIGGYRSPSEDPNVGRRDNAQPRIDEMRRRPDPMNNSTVPGNERPVYKSESRLNAKERMLLATYPEDQKKYAKFLSQPGTGLFRLLP